MRRLIQLLGLSLLLSTAATAQGTTDEDALVEELLQGTDDLTRGDSSTSTMTMQVKTSRYERTVKMQSWTQGTERSLIRILAPAKEAGIATLKIDDNIWNYLPKVDRTMKVPASMMSGSWMGSHITNDDLVRESRLSEDFDYAITARPEGGEGYWMIELVPKPDTPIVWGRITVKIRADKIPEELAYYDEDGELIRSMFYEDIADISGRKVPMTMRVVPADKPEEYTVITFQDLAFDVDIPDETFSLQALRR